MRTLLLGAMSSSSTNPFDRFALGAPSSSPSRSHPVPMGPVETTRAKKIRTTKLSCGTSPHARPEQPRGLVEKYRSPGEPEWPLRLIIVGHNPSEKAWELGHYYANPSNRMWKILSKAGIVPPDFTASDDDRCPISCGVGFTDVGFSIPGTVSSEFKKTDLHAWREGFYDRLTAHAERAAETVAAAAVAAAAADTTATTTREEPATCADSTSQDVPTGDTTELVMNGCPQVVAFAGKRQWEELFFDASKHAKARTKGGKAGQFRFGLQPADLRPPGWPFPSEATEVFVVPSSSGAAAMTHESREAPYLELGNRMSRFGDWAHRPSCSELQSCSSP